MLNRKMIAMGAVIGLLVGSALSTPVNAADVDVEASIVTKAAISLTKNNDMSFGDIEFDTTHAGDIQLGTDGNVALSGTSGLTATGTPNAADVDVAGDGNSVIEISCETGGTLADTSSNTLTLSAVEFDIDTGSTPGNGTACAGLGSSPGTVDLSANATPTILLGGTINVNGNAIAASGTYSTANTGQGGDPVTLRVVYQ